MTIYDLKPKFQALLRPIVNKLAKKSITPNQVTVAAIILSILGGLIVIAASLYSLTLLILIPFIMFFRMALNAIDGILAKEHNMTSKKGAILNEFGDVFSDIVLYLPFALILNSFIIVIFVIIAICTELMGILTQAIYNQRRYDGPIGKSDRAFIFGAISLLVVINPELVTLINVIVGGLLIPLIYTVYNRWIKATESK